MARSYCPDWIVPIGAPPVRQGTLVLADDGRVLAIEERPSPGAERIRGVVLPALVNAHVHLELSALRGKVPGGKGFIPWVTAFLSARAGLDRQGMRDAIPGGLAEAIRYGTGAVGDVSNTLYSLEFLAQSGIYGVLFHEILEIDELPAGDAIRQAFAEREKCRHWPKRIAYALAPHAPTTTSPRLIERAMRALPSAPTTIHLAEDPAEIALLERGEGPWVDLLEQVGLWSRLRTAPRQRPLMGLASLGLLEREPPPLLVHMVHATHEELALVARKKAPVVLCPRSNLHIGGELPDVPAMVREGVSLALGTDSLASNASLSLWSEMATLADAFPTLDPARVVEWATQGGAYALGLDDGMGTLALGERPGVIAIGGEAGSDPYRFLVHAQPQEVQWLSRA